MLWKKRKIQEKKEKLAKEEDQKKKDYKSGKQFGLSGKEMFSFNPDLADDGPVEDGDAVFDSYDRSDDDDEAFEYKELDLEEMALAAQEVIYLLHNKFIVKIIFNQNLGGWYWNCCYDRSLAC